MTSANSQSSPVQDAIDRIIYELTRPESPLPDDAKKVLKQSLKQAAAWSQQAGSFTYESLERTTQTIGSIAQPIATHPVVETVTRLPWLSWLVLWLGQVDANQAQADVERLRLQYPADHEGAIAQRIIDDAALQAGRIGLLTNIVPPVALALLAVDLVAVTKLQAEMIYRVAAAYGFDLSDSTRRGEVIAALGVSLGTGTPLKAGLSIVELVPVIGAVVGASSNAILLYLLGGVARQFYEMKRQRRMSQIPIQD